MKTILIFLAKTTTVLVVVVAFAFLVRSCVSKVELVDNDVSFVISNKPSHQIVRVWCKQKKIVVREPEEGKWKLLDLSDQCAKTCEPLANRIQVVNHKCEWLSVKPMP